MYPQQIHTYLQTFFQENNCPILSANPHYLIIQLTNAMDKKIMNRPFYWQYIESTGGDPVPAQLTLITDRAEVAPQIVGETIHFGSPRLTQLFGVTKEMGSFICMYERGSGGEELILTPWLSINYKVSYQSHRTKEALYSLGMNLMTGEVFKAFQESIVVKDLQETIPPQAFNLPYTIKPMIAIERLDAIIEAYIMRDDHAWVEEAQEKWAKEKLVLDYFYEGIDVKPKRYALEQEALKQQYEAEITIEVVNGGLFYLTSGI